jgi:hypothetical protein
LPPTQVPLWQESLSVQALPSLQVVPLLTLEYCAVLTPGWHVTHVFAPFAAPEVTHAPPMEQKPVLSVGAVQTPVDALQAPGLWQESGAVHVTWLPAMQTPAWHVSFESQRLPSLHAAPVLTLEYCVVLAAGWHVWHVLAPFAAPEATQAPPMEQKPALSVGAEQTPVEGLHAPGLWQESGAVHVTVLPAVQTPAWHVSFESQRLPSLQDVPLLTLEYCVVLTAGWQVSHVIAPFVAPEVTHAPPMEQKPVLSVGAEQTPVDASQTPGLWQESDAEQVTWLPAVQTPDWHVSSESQRLPSLQDVPLAATGFEHCPVAGLHVPISWHGSLAVHVTDEHSEISEPKLSSQVTVVPEFSSIPAAATAPVKLDGLRVTKALGATNRARTFAPELTLMAEDESK